MSWLVEFYSQVRTDSEGRMLEEIWAFDTAELENNHDFIQWLFPLDEPSAFNPDAPLVTAEDQRCFAEDSILRNSLRRSFEVFLRFLGLTLTGDGRVELGDQFETRRQVWEFPNHNWLRVTRVLKSLRLLGLREHAAAFFARLQVLHEEHGWISEHTFRFWREALRE